MPHKVPGDPPPPLSDDLDVNRTVNCVLVLALI